VEQSPQPSLRESQADQAADVETRSQILPVPAPAGWIMESESSQMAASRAAASSPPAISLDSDWNTAAMSVKSSAERSTVPSVVENAKARVESAGEVQQAYAMQLFSSTDAAPASEKRCELTTGESGQDRSSANVDSNSHTGKHHDSCGGWDGCVSSIGNCEPLALDNLQGENWKQETSTETPPTEVRKRRRSESHSCSDMTLDPAGTKARPHAGEGPLQSVKLEKQNCKEEAMGMAGTLIGTGDEAIALETDDGKAGTAKNPIKLD
jgi:hypothetical protein